MLASGRFGVLVGAIMPQEFNSTAVQHDLLFSEPILVKQICSRNALKRRKIDPLCLAQVTSHRGCFQFKNDVEKKTSTNVVEQNSICCQSFQFHLSFDDF